MKKIIILITSVALLSACNQEKNNEFEFDCTHQIDDSTVIERTHIVNKKTEELARKELGADTIQCTLTRRKDLSFKNY